MAFSLPPDQSRKIGSAALGLIGLLLLGFLIYSSIVKAPFIYDDRGIVTENQTIKSLPIALRNFSNSRYVGYLSFALNYAYGGLAVQGYHLVNIGIHLANALMLFMLVRLSSSTPEVEEAYSSEDFLAFSSAFLFLVHPLQTQAVSYVSQRFASLTTLFYLTSLLFYIKARLCQVRGDGKRSNKIIGYFIFSLLSAVLAMKTKEIAYTIPIMAFLSEISFFGLRDQNKKIRTIVKAFPLVIALSVLLLSGFMLAGRSLGDAVSSLDSLSRETVQISRSEYLWTQFRVVTTYLRLMLLPMNQNLDYDYPVSTTLFSQDMILPLVVLGALVFLAVVSYRRVRLLSFGIAWFFIALLVESSVIPIRDVINEHRMYLPSVGLCIASMAAVDRAVQHQRGKIGLVVMIIICFAVGTMNRNRVWQSPGSLWSDVISKAPNNARAYNNLGIVYKEQKFYGTANELFEKALQADKNYTAVYYNLGDVQYGLGNYEKALEYLDMAMKGKKDRLLHVDILNKMGRTYGAMGRKEQAIDSFLTAITLYPASPVFRNNLAVQYIKAERFDEAIATLEQALVYAPGEDYLFLNLANAYAGKGDEEKRAMMAEKARQIKRAKQP